MRKMMRRPLAGLIGLALLAGAPALAQDPTPLQPTEILHGRFTQERILTGIATPLKSEGSFVLAPEHGLIWRVETPFAVTTVMTGNGIAQFNGETEMVNLSAAQAPVLAHLYQVLGGALTGDIARLEERFDVAKSTSGNDWQLALTPREAATADATQIEAIIIRGSRYIDRIEIAKASGDEDRLIFHDQTIVSEAIDPKDAELLDRAGAK
ncbi:outer membrane lipoprotein carrier protein LolA [Dongia sp.]|uniref:outer membrane lipoprotein carrier protein LolA n=1 Tax=Dongia sp. TaxID=1977262 RepID=UPI0035B350C3